MSCNNLNNTLKIYNIIRDNGGWDNWEMVEIAKYNCKDNTEARIKEQEHYELLKANLNCVSPFIDKKYIFCNTCNIQCLSLKHFEKHNQCKLHVKKEERKNKTTEDKIMPKNAGFYCSFCDFKCSKKSNWEIHTNTKKHVYRLSGNEMEMPEIQKNANFVCNCGKIFKSNSGLWKHKNKCKIDENSVKLEQEDDKDIPDKDELILILIKQNAELIKEQTSIRQMMSEQQTMVFELAKNGTNNSNNSHNTNSHNKSFNLQFFLNETCKDAMNITEFVDSIKLQLSDLENVGKLGYVEGISNIITSNLKALDVTQRPVHCTDKKRETIYIKDEDKWEKEDDEKKKLRRAIKRVAFKNQKLLPDFKEKYPDYKKSTSRVSDQYNKILIESMGGSGDNDLEKENKIIRNILKASVIDKE
jgi:hypothetical protein